MGTLSNTKCFIAAKRFNAFGLINGIDIYFLEKNWIKRKIKRKKYILVWEFLEHCVLWHKPQHK